MIIELKEGKLHIRFRVNEDQTVELVDFSTLPDSSEMPMIAARPEAGFFAPFKPRQFLAVQVTGECAGGFHAGKHDVGSVSAEWRYRGHAIEENGQGQLLKLSVKAPDGTYVNQIDGGEVLVHKGRAVEDETVDFTLLPPFQRLVLIFLARCQAMLMTAGQVQALLPPSSAVSWR